MAGSDLYSSYAAEGNSGKVTANGLMTVRAYLTYNATAQNPTRVVTLAAEEGTVTEATYSNCNYLDFETTSKTLPKIEDAATWSLITDDPEKPVGETFVGKSEKIAPIELTVPTALQLEKILSDHKKAGSVWTLMFTYDDPNEDSKYQIFVKRCKIIGFGGDGGETNSASTSVVKFQPYGGKLVPQMVATARATGSTN